MLKCKSYMNSAYCIAVLRETDTSECERKANYSKAACIYHTLKYRWDPWSKTHVLLEYKTWKKRVLLFFARKIYILKQMKKPVVFYRCNTRLRPSSDVVLLPCRTKLQFGSTVARQEINSDSDVVPESNQIQGLLKPHVTVLLLTRRGNAISPEHINIIYDFSLVRQKHDV